MSIVRNVSNASQGLSYGDLVEFSCAPGYWLGPGAGSVGTARCSHDCGKQSKILG